MMKMYIASVRDKETGKIKIIESEYRTKKDFANDIRKNGYTVRFITTEEKFDEDCEKYYERTERQKMSNRIRREIDRKLAEEAGMSVTEYRRWLYA